MTGRLVPWRRPREKVFEWDPGQPDERGHYFRWYVGGVTNVAWNAVDRHVQQGRGGVAALVCENERGGRQVITYAQLSHQVRQAAAALRGLGIGKGRPGRDLHADLRLGRHGNVGLRPDR